MKKKPVLLWTLALLLSACSSESNTPAAPEETVHTPAVPTPEETTTPGESTPKEPPPAATTSPTSPPEWEGMPPDDRLIQTYRAIVCHMQKADQKAVEGVWKQYGYDDTSWALEFQKAIQRADTDRDGFGKRWRKAKRTRCP